jgi:hypothetical protein
MTVQQTEDIFSTVCKNLHAWFNILVLRTNDVCAEHLKLEDKYMLFTFHSKGLHFTSMPHKQQYYYSPDMKIGDVNNVVNTLQNE